MAAELFKRSELVDKVAKALNISKQKAGDTVSVFFTFIKTAVVDEGKYFRVPILGGTLKKVNIPARQARNPKTGEIVNVGEKWKIKYEFKAEKV